MAGYRILSFATSVQVGTIDEEVDRGVSCRLDIGFRRDAHGSSLPFYQDKLHEEKVFQRFNEILTKVGLYFGSRTICQG